MSASGNDPPDWVESGGLFGGDDDVQGDTPAMRDNIMFLIDSREGMFKHKNDEGKTVFENCVRATLDFVKAKIIAGADDKVGVILMGTKEQNTRDNFEGVYVLSHLMQPGIETVQDLEGLLPVSDNDDPHTKLGHLGEGKPLPIDKALWACSSEFSPVKKSKNPEYKRIFVFTCDDNPVAGDEEITKQSKQRANDLAELEHIIAVYGIATPATDNQFQFDKFWSNIATKYETEEEDLDEDGYTTVALRHDQPFDMFLERVRSRTHKKRSYAKLNFKIAEDINLAVGLFMNIYPAKKPTAKKVEATNMKPVVPVTQWICKDSGKALEPKEIKHYHKFGGKTIYFSKSDVRKLKYFGPSGITLMGFKPRSYVKDYHNMRPPYFVYPNESAMKGSTKAFRALHQQMIAKDKVAIVRLIPRANALPKFVALLPVEEELDEDGTQTSPPGMYGIALPYADDIRCLQQSDKQEDPPEEAVSKAKDVVNKLDIPTFSSRDFTNPVIQKFYAAAQALALGEDDVDWKEENDDTLKPDMEGFMNFKEDLEQFDKSITPAGVDRSAPTATAGKKRARAPAPKLDAEDMQKWKEAKTNGTLSKKTMPQLKELLKSAGKPVSGKKAELVARAEEYLDTV
eukprot:gb/GECG01012331.1/.p1 GENE.gb/GECG01012331.1/~~gb/GECG01012331.1/.p1  ORF type:complete len:627 (+),score=109.72 gb/GECG01012331.1/:1-1881(+)